jgi:hypothetical protein
MTHGEYIRLGTLLGQIEAGQDHLSARVRDLHAYCRGGGEPQRAITRDKAEAVRALAAFIAQAAYQVVDLMDETSAGSGQ